jgi:hypothetical protein
LRDKCVAIKIKLIELSKDDYEIVETECVKLAKEIVDFNRSFRKRKSKKKRNEIEGDDDTLGSESGQIPYDPPQKEKIV